MPAGVPNANKRRRGDDQPFIRRGNPNNRQVSEIRATKQLPELEALSGVMATSL